MTTKRGGGERQQFSKDHDDFLAMYLAKNSGSCRRGNVIYEQMVEDPHPLAKKHTPHSWRERYIKNIERLEKLIEKYRRTHLSVKQEPNATPLPAARKTIASQSTPRARNPFTHEEKELLAQYIAQENPGNTSRLGNVLYVNLTNNLDKWPWAKTHPRLSWQEQYKKNREQYDKRVSEILAEKHKGGRTIFNKKANEQADGANKRKRGDDEEQEKPPSKRKRVVPVPSKSDTEDSGSETEEEDQLEYDTERGPSPSQIEALRREYEEDSQPYASGSGQAQLARREEEEGEEDAQVVDEQEEGSDLDEGSGSDSEMATEAILLRKDSEDVGDSTSAQAVTRTTVDANRRRSMSSDLDYVDIPSSVPQESQTYQQPISQVIPSPETLRRIGLADKPSQVKSTLSQEPTPPASAQPSSPARSGNHSPMSGPAHPRPSVARKRKLRADDEDIFASPSPRASPAGPAKQHREPPVLVDGLLNKAFTDRKGRSNFADGARRLSGVAREEPDASSQQDKPWPPVRSRNKDKEKAVDPPQNKAAPAEASQSQSSAPAQHHIFSQPTQEFLAQLPPAVLSKSRVHRPLVQSTQYSLDASPPPAIVKSTTKQDVPQKISKEKRKQLVEALAKLKFLSGARLPAESKTDPAPVAGPSKAVLTEPQGGRGRETIQTSTTAILARTPQPDPVVNHTADLMGPPTPPPATDMGKQKAAMQPLSPLPDRSQKAIQATLPFSQPRPPSPKPVVNPIADLIGSPTSPPAVNKGKQKAAMQPPPVLRDRRHTIGASVPMHSDTPPGSGYVFKGLELSVADSKFAMVLGMDAALAKMAAHHCFQPSVALHVWQQVGDLQLTDKILREMSLAAGNKLQEYADLMQLQKSSEPDFDDQGRAPASRAVPSGSNVRGDNVSVPSTPELNLLAAQKPNGRNETLKYIPFDITEEDVEYRPPTDTRAAQFARLLADNRIDEARKRDHKRRKSGFMPPTTPYKSG